MLKQGCTVHRIICRKTRSSENALPPPLNRVLPPDAYHDDKKQKKAAVSEEASVENTVAGASGSADGKQGDGQDDETTVNVEGDDLTAGQKGGRALETWTATDNAIVSDQVCSYRPVCIV